MEEKEAQLLFEVKQICMRLRHLFFSRIIKVRGRRIDDIYEPKRRSSSKPSVTRLFSENKKGQTKKTGEGEGKEDEEEAELIEISTTQTAIYQNWIGEKAIP